MKVNNVFIIGILLGCFTFGAVIADEFSQQNIDFAERQERHLRTIAKYSSDSSSEAIEKLGAILRWLSHDAEPEYRKSPALELSRERLLQIPGFAEHFKQRILAISAWENGESTVQTRGERGWYYQTLTQLPHPETIRVLGELLRDDRGHDKGKFTDCRYVPNSVNASYALRNIGLRTAPAARLDGDAWEEVETWRLWFEQVQHGKPFSFEGDARIYTLAESPQTAANRHERRPSPRESGSAAKAEDRASWSEHLVIFGLLALVVTIVTTKLIRKSTKP